MKNWIWTAALAAASVVGAASPGKAQQLEQSYPWCSQYSAQSDARDCSFYTFRQCLQTVSGVGGYCFANPAYARAQVAPRRPRRY
jgi:uncharacterized protein DUF3551